VSLNMPDFVDTPLTGYSFIIANFPGAIAGAVAGNRLGAVRDAKGKSVYSVFQEMPQSDKAKLLSELAAKLFATAVTG
jgi:hypothetical protein